jgi:hypothetical protein
MDNVYDQYVIEEGEASPTSSESSEDMDHQSELLTNNRGVLYDSFNNNETLMNQRSASEYDNLRNKYFTPELIKRRVLIDSKNVQHDTNHSTSNYTVFFDGDSQEKNITNITSGFSKYRNVIGFKLIQSILPNTTYQINENHNQILFKVTQSSTEYSYTAIMTPGSYTFEELAIVFQTSLNDQTLSPLSITFTITPDTTSFKYSVSWDTSDTVLFLWDSSPGHPHRILGALNIDETSYQSKPIQLPHVVDHSSHYVDLVIPEIPYLACKENILGKNIIDRIPLNEPNGVIVNSIPYNDHAYFHPITLDKLTIQLYEDSSGLFYQCQNADNSFEFEIVMLNRNINL